MNKKYKTGMYGGKFLPFHKGHLHCMQKAAEMCETLYLIMFVGGALENTAMEKIHGDEDTSYLTVESRRERIAEIVKEYPNVKFVVIDVSSTIRSDGFEDWDLQTPMVIEACGKLDAVFGSEPSYADYFSRAYPEAEYVLIDVDRNECPISGTKVREMNPEERAKWIA